MTELADGGRLSDATPGQRVVLTVYVAVVAIAATMGALLGYINPQGMDPVLFFVVDLPPTPLGMAAYGAVTVAVVLGVLLGLVRIVSRYDSARVE